MTKEKYVGKIGLKPSGVDLTLVSDSTIDGVEFKEKEEAGVGIQGCTEFEDGRPLLINKHIFLLGTFR